MSSSMNYSGQARALLQIDVTGWAPARVTDLLAFANASAADAASETGDSTGRAAVDDELVEPSGWEQDTLLAAYAELRNNRSWPQVNVIEQAAKNGGYISREETYQAAGFDPAKRSLKGLTRPVNRVVTKLQDAGQVPDDVEDLLQPVYDDTISGYQRASGFRIPGDVCKWIRGE
jgi:hypothetical protein